MLFLLPVVRSRCPAQEDAASNPSAPGTIEEYVVCYARNTLYSSRATNRRVSIPLALSALEGRALGLPIVRNE